MYTLAAQKVFRGLLFVVKLGMLTFPGAVTGAEAGDLINGEFDASNKQERVEIARSILTSVEKLSQFVPAPKPSEEAWLEQERLAIQKLTNREAISSRRLALYESPEFQNSKLFHALTKLSAYLDCAMKEGVPIRTEMKCWSLASLTLTDSTTINDAVMILRRKGRLPKDIEKQAELGREDGLGYSVHFGWYRRGILEFLIVPYLGGDIVQ